MDDSHEYPYEDFRAHVRAMETVHGYQTVRPSYDARGDDLVLDIADKHGFELTLFRVLDYFAQLIPDDESRRVSLATRFMVALSTVADHHAELVLAGLAEPSVTEEGPAFTSEAVFRAVHHLVLRGSMPRRIAADELIAEARRFEEAAEE